MRFKNRDEYLAVDITGWGHIAGIVRLRDGSGNDSVLPLPLPAPQFHPQTDPPGLIVPLKRQRFATLSLSLAEFVSANPTLDLADLVGVEIELTTDGSVTLPIWLALDDLRFE